MLTIFGNLRINSATRLQHMKDSFESFDGISDNWVLNIRGSFREEAIEFLSENLRERMTLYDEFSNSSNWVADSLKMMNGVKYKYILIWNEDHLNIAPQDLYLKIIKEMSKGGVEYMGYSWWLEGKSTNVFNRMDKELGLEKMTSINILNLNKEKWKRIRETGYTYFILSSAGIYHIDLWNKLLNEERWKFPMFFTRMVFKFFALLSFLGLRFNHKDWFHIVSRVFFYKLGRFSQKTPFNLERPPIRTDVLPLRMALPKQELFACIDDDLDTPGYSLISRGFYKEKKFNKPVNNYIKTILEEVNTVLNKIEEIEVDEMVKALISARRIIAVGAGRVGLVTKAFVMRLGHLGLEAYLVGDTTLPAMGEQDLLLASSGSGETKTILELVTIAKRNKAKVTLVTGDRESSMGKLADIIVTIRAPLKTKKVDSFESIQPMTTLNEQSLSIFFDAVVLRLMEELNETHDTMWARHSNLE